MRKALIVLAGVASLSLPLLATGCGDDERDEYRDRDRREIRYDRDDHRDWDRDRDYHDRDWDRR